jgi:hypothetical protein
MALTRGYATLARYKAQYLPSTSTSAADDTVIEILIEAASRFIDKELYPRTFYARTETHYFDLEQVVNGRALFFNDYLLSATTLTNGDATTIAATAYILFPVSERATTAITIPNYKLELRPSAAVTFISSDGDTKRAISLLGSWGYDSTTPLDIEQACMEIAHNAYQRKEGHEGDVITRITAGGVLIQPQDINSFVMRILNRHPRHLGVGIG